MDSSYDEDGFATFAFQDLDYIPFGVGGTLAPYIETPAATMRAAATLMCLDNLHNLPALNSVSNQQDLSKIVVCDLGCGDGDARSYSQITLSHPSAHTSTSD
jgi:hypothetical protein